MEKPTKAPITVYTPNQVIASNLHRARLEKGWTQGEAAERIAPHLGVHWSAASYSLCERSVERTDRVRVFGGDELVALSRAFELPILFFLLPPNLPPGEDVRIAPPGVAEDEALTAGPYLEAILGAPAGPGVLAERLEELERDHPGEMAAPYFARLREVSEVASLSAIKNTVTAIKRRAQGLHDLATMLEEAAEQTADRMQDALDRQLTESGDESPAEPSPRSGHARPH